MTKEEFNNLEKDTYFYDDRLSVEWQVLESNKEEGHHCICSKHNEATEGDSSYWQKGEKWTWFDTDAYYFTAGRHSDNAQPQPTPHQITCTVEEAIEKELKVGDDVKIVIEGKIDVLSKFDRSIYVKYKDGSFGNWVFRTAQITFTPTPETFTPKHDELCGVLTTEGFATQCRAYEHDGELYAIPLKEGKPDGCFNPEQISKFYKL
jgi:hypothetical protein